MKLSTSLFLGFVLPLGMAVGLRAQTNTFPSSGNVGIGTTTPETVLVVNSAANSNGAGSSSLLVKGADNKERIEIASVGSGASIFEAHYFGGTLASPSVTPSGSVLGWFLGGGYVNSSSVPNTAGMLMVAEENFSGTALGTSLRFQVTNTGSTARTEAMRISPAGDVGIGVTAPGAKLDVYGAGRFAGALTVGYHSNLGPSNALVLGTVAKAVPASGGQGSIQVISNDASNQLQGVISLVTDATGDNRRLSIVAVEQGIAWRNVTLAEGGGNVGIGTANPTQKLSVNGTIRAKEVIVDSGWSDFVFADSYRLTPLSEVEAQIKVEKHLPGIPSAREIADHGASVGEMQARILAKVEELTLHAIAQEKAISALRSENAALRANLSRLENLSARTP